MIDLSAARDPEPESNGCKKGTLFVPIIDNGQGDVKANFMMFFNMAFADRSIKYERFSDSLAPRARNKACASFLHTDCEYLLFVDCDIIFTKDHINMLMESEEPLLIGLYCKKSPGFIDPCINTLPGMPPTETGGYIEVKRGGTGFMRIHRDVLERMKGPKEATDLENFLNDWAAYYANHGRDEWDFFPIGVRHKEYLSEDWYFCDRSRDTFIQRANIIGYPVKKMNLGYKVILDSRIQLRHEGTAIYPIEEIVQRSKNDTNGTVKA